MKNGHMYSLFYFRRHFVENVLKSLTNIVNKRLRLYEINIIMLVYVVVVVVVVVVFVIIVCTSLF